MNDQIVLKQHTFPVLVGLDSHFFAFDSSEPLNVTLRSNFEWNNELETKLSGTKNVIILVDSPYIIIPETLYTSGMDPLLMHEKYPYLSLSTKRYHADTWTGSYAKCVYYIPNKYYKLNGLKYYHWWTALERFSQHFFDQYDSGIWSFRLKEKLYVLVKVNRTLQDVKVLYVPSPDDSTYHILKIVEQIKNQQDHLAIWTNEKNSFHLSILNQYIPHVIVNDNELPALLNEIISPLCVL